jgi:hypothetical protein
VLAVFQKLGEIKGAICDCVTFTQFVGQLSTLKLHVNMTALILLHVIVLIMVLYHVL